MIHSSLYERLTPGELKTVIGHECGHIHNMHGVYSIMVVILFEGASLVLSGGITRTMFNISYIWSAIRVKLLESCKRSYKRSSRYDLL